MSPKSRMARPFGEVVYREPDFEWGDKPLLAIEGEFGPELIQQLSGKWRIPTNFMFIGSPGDHFPYRIEELGGVRLII